MPSWETIFKTLILFGGALASFLFGSWTGLLTTLLAMVIIDYLTGILASFIEGNLSSAHGFKGIAKKVLIFAIVAVAHLIDVILGQTMMIRDMTIYFYIANEMLSIIENAGRAGIPVPQRLKKAIVVLRNKK
ncbi:phage holin family protein [Caldalkalibacillus mannanilyticus]|uniref:phage holin family protein n=1 Tax=Caldalkalibacillus mannanilyticus TaxID=1418 RepID=UPI000469D768|nr:phage holin family protein [Caldalkalibacillus mannanilyticus]